MKTYVFLIIFLILIILTILFYSKTEYFADCIIHIKNNENICNSKYSDKGELQLIYDRYMSNDVDEIRKIYLNKKKYNIKSCQLKLDKLYRPDNLKNKKIILDNSLNTNIPESTSEWANCHFDDIIDLKNLNVKNNRVLFNNPDYDKTIKNICLNYDKLITVPDSNVFKKLLKIECYINENFSINSPKKPEEINIKSIRIVHYDGNNMEIQEDNEDFINTFFTLYYNINEFIYIPIKKEFKFKLFKNNICNKYVEDDIRLSKEFDIGEIGLTKIKLLDNPFSDLKSLENDNFAINNDYTIGIKDKENMEEIIKNNINDVKDDLLNNTKNRYVNCKNKLNLEKVNSNTYYSKCAKSIRKATGKKRLYGDDNCVYYDCDHHKIRCDLTNVNKFIDKLNDVEDINDIMNDKSLKDSVKEISEKPYNICKDKSDYIKGEFVDNLDNIQKYSSIIMDQKYKDKELRNFDNKNLKCDFSLLKYISQDNCIYIEIN